MIPSFAVVGMKHSGSTMIYNLLFFVLEQKYKVSEPKNYIFKSHSFKKYDEDVKIILTLRDVRDTCISGFLRFDYAQSLDPKESLQQVDFKKEVLKFGLFTFLHKMYENINYFNIWLSSDPIIVKYENMQKDMKGNIHRLFMDLGIEHDELFVQECIDHVMEFKDRNDLAHNLDEYHKMRKDDIDVPLLTKDHDTSGGKIGKYKDFFTREQLEIIHEDPVIVPFLSLHGYELTMLP